MSALSEITEITILINKTTVVIDTLWLFLYEKMADLELSLPWWTPYT